MNFNWIHEKFEKVKVLMNLSTSNSGTNLNRRKNEKK